MNQRTKFCIFGVLLCVPTLEAGASYGIYVGKDLTVDGSVLLGGTGDEVSSHWLEIVPRRTHPAGATIRVGVDDRATYPGMFIEIPQVRETAKYIAMNYSHYEGLPSRPSRSWDDLSGVSRPDPPGRRVASDVDTGSRMWNTSCI